MKAKEIPHHELIGRDVEVIESNNKLQVGTKGKIIDETRNTITLEQENKTKMMMKDQVIIKMKIGKRFYRINGKILVGRPEDRLTKTRRIR